MSTYATMISRIEDEIHRANINADVRRAILSAIAHYEKTGAFDFNDERSTSATIDGEKYYNLPDDFERFIGRFPLEITVNQSTYPLNRRGWDYLTLIDLDAVVDKGIPFDWTYGDRQLRLYPIPNAVYPLCLHYKKSLPVITDDADSNAWLTDDGGERLIRARAKWDLYKNRIHQFDKGNEQKVIELEAENILRGNAANRAATGIVTPHYL